MVRRVIEGIACVVSIAFLLWIFLSWAEVVSKNSMPNPTYSESNAFVLFINMADKEAHDGDKQP